MNDKLKPRKHKYTAAEKVEMGETLVNYLLEMADLKAAKKRSADSYAADIRQIEIKAEILVGKLNDGFEMVYPEQTEIPAPDPGAEDGGKGKGK